jgi:hypothetical protein
LYRRCNSGFGICPTLLLFEEISRSYSRLTPALSAYQLESACTEGAIAGLAYVPPSPLSPLISFLGLYSITGHWNV